MIYSANTPPFNELILSWNGLRPSSTWTFWVSLFPDEWLKFAEWGPNHQRSFKSIGLHSQSYQDVVTPKEGVCRRYQVRIEGEELSKLHSITVSVSKIEDHALSIPQNLPPVHLVDVPRQSQLVLEHPRCKDFCSPTSTTTALRFLTKKAIDPVSFASRIHDSGFDIYGNWVLNVAEAYNQSQIPCHVERLKDFTQLHQQLMNGRPVVVSVKGSLPGAPKPYNAGHLICVIGYEAEKVYCIDSAYPDNESTYVAYPLADFLSAWGVRRNLAYVFQQN